VITIVDDREERIAEKHGSTGWYIYKEAVKRFLEDEIGLEEMMDRVMEFARGNWTLMVDENRMGGLVSTLRELRYRVRTVRPGETDGQIVNKFKQGNYSGVFITEDRGDFSLDQVPDIFDEGLILLPGIGQPEQQAKAIENVLMHWRDNHGGRPVRVRLTKKDVVKY